MSPTNQITLNPARREDLLRGGAKKQQQQQQQEKAAKLPLGKQHTHPRGSSTGDEDGSVSFVGTATTILEWQGVRILTDPNFLHAGDHVHLGPGVSARRRTDPAVELEALPPLDAILLSHYHEDHFDRLVEDSLNRDFTIVTTPHARSCLAAGGAEDEPFRRVWGLDLFQDLLLDIDDASSSAAGERHRRPAIKVTGMPGRYVPPGVLSAANEVLQAVPPTNGWMLELGYRPSAGDGDEGAMETGYRIYISGDTLMVDDLKKIPEWLGDKRIDLMLVHLGGTTIPGPSLPLLMVTMDAEQGLQLMRLLDPEITIPIHYDDYDVFLSPLEDFKKEVDGQGKRDRVVYLDRGEHYRFKVRG
ncbi:Lactamase_B domain containing protein [Pyricularia oryzae]|uniref:Lactamase_B domain containing protein n=1 Tax=Pyricularia oryzae (strain Y34) TaxID=1143189 RepID=A0AA97PQN9_PYRO3|nr:Lactamase_B domain containing protein [Pyricularia oryzae Y34]KAI7924515.1 Lactamase_B domain containing protein [Pyricularia oryzae]